MRNDSPPVAGAEVSAGLGAAVPNEKPPTYIH